MKELQRITIPLRYANNIDHLFISPEKRSIPIIACKNKKKNLYTTTKIREWNDIQLASCSWKKSEKYLNDYFTIDVMSKLPAWKDAKNSFHDLGLESNVINSLQQNGYLKPTNIQILSIPVILRGLNTLIGGETGGGKTLSYVAPILNMIVTTSKKINNYIGPKSLILAPSWELCTQINKVMLTVGSNLNINTSILKSFNDLNTESEVIVSTPHTLNTAIKSGDINISKLKSVILDEADMLLDPSFCDSVVDTLSKLSIQTSRPVNEVTVGTQLILCNATYPARIEEAFGKYVPTETFAIIETEDMHKLIPCVSHKFIRSNFFLKSTLLITLLKSKGLTAVPSTIIFCNRTETLKTLSNTLAENAIDHVALHKNLPFTERLENFDKFQKGEARILLSTDLGARGLDTPKATHVINYEFPRIISEYIHRAGRIGRVGSCGGGKVTNIISSKNEVNAVQIIERAIRQGGKIPNIDTVLDSNKKLSLY